MFNLIQQQRNESTAKASSLLPRTALATICALSLFLGALTAGAQATVGPDIDSAKDKTVAWGTDWSFDKPTLHKGDCSDGDVDVDVVYTITNSLCGRSYQAIRKWEAKDNCGFKDTCKQIVTVLDSSVPVLFAMPHKTVECGEAWGFDLPTAIDSGDGSPLAISLVAVVTNILSASVTAVTSTWETSDGCGHTARGSQIVTIEDRTPPEFAAVLDRTVELGEAWAFDAPSAFDACSGTAVELAVSSTMTNFSRGGSFSATRSWIATDAGGNTSILSQTVTVIDTMPPALNAPADLRVRAGTAWSFGIPEMSDAGGAVTLAVEGTITNRACGGSYMARRSWRATDTSGNSALCSQSVTVTDDEAPIVTCPAAKTVEAGLDWGFDLPTAIDTGDAGNVPLTIRGNTTNAAPGGGSIITRVWRATDSCGNSAECSQVVTVVDTLPPVFAPLPAGAVYRCFGDVPPPAVVEAMDTADGRLVAACQTLTNGVCPASIIHTWTVSDRQGNTATASQTNLVVIEPLRIIVEPTDRAVCAGERVELCVEVAGGCSTSYEWSKDGRPLPGATGPCLVLNSASEADAGQYCVRISGSFCPAGEAPLTRCATLTVHPVISVAPLAGVSRRVGEMATFRTSVSGTVLTCIWRRNGVVIPGESGASLTIPSVEIVDAGSYSVEIGGPCGSESQSATLTVLAAPDGNTLPFLSSIVDRLLQHDRSTGEVPFTIGDAETPAAELLVSAMSSDPMLLPLANIILGGAGSTRTVMIVAPSAGYGEVMVTIAVSDGRDTARTSFKVTIALPNPVSSRLTICLHGEGSVTPNLNGQELLLGQTYTVRAVHGAGSMFTGWTGAVAGSNPVLSFVMATNLTLNVGFQPNPYLGLPGSYNGLFYEADEVRNDTSGFVTLQRNAKGSYSGAVMSGGRRLRFSGRFDALGNATNIIRRGKLTPFLAELHLGAGDRPDEISGRIADGVWSAGLLADRAAFHAITNRAPFAGRYTLVIPGHPLDPTCPAGDGFGTMVVSPRGLVTFGGTLADGRKVSQRVLLGRGGEWPLYAGLYRGSGSLLGWQTFGTRATEDVGGLLSWIRPPQARAARFAAGFSFDTVTTGSRYVKPSAGHRVLDFSEGVVSFSGGGIPMFANSVMLLPDNKVVNRSGNRLQLFINQRNGLYRGCVVNPATGVMEAFQGALLQKQNRGSGFCPGLNGVGRVAFEAAP